MVRVKRVREREMQGEWGMGKRCNRRRLFDAAASTLNSLSSWQCRSAGDARSLLLTAPLRAAPTPCLTLAGSSTYHTTPNHPHQVLCMPELKHMKALMPFHHGWLKMGHLSESWTTSCCNSVWPVWFKSQFIPVWGKSSPIELGGICHHPKPSLSDESTC